MRDRPWILRGVVWACGPLGLAAALGTTPAGAQSSGRAAAPVSELAEKIEVGPVHSRRSVEVRVQKWIIDGHEKIDALDLPGGADVRVVQLAAGQITTVIGGRRVERVEGEWWTVPAGEGLGLVTGNDSAILWAISAR